MPKTSTYLTTSKHLSLGRKKRAGLVLVCGLTFAVHLLVGVTISSLGFSNKVQAKSIFSWFTGNNEKPIDELLTKTEQAPALSQKPKQQAAFGELAYHYFQQDYPQVLLLIAVGNAKHGFAELSKEDTDRLNLMQGASQMQEGLYTLSQAKFATLLSQTTSDYVQANTWFFMAKAGFENQQAFISEQAYNAILQGDLRKNLSDSQWHELLYITAYTRMQANQDWQSLQEQIPTQNIYSAYLQANQGALLFNNAEYEQASLSFIMAKQALIEHKNKRGEIERAAINVYDSVSWALRPWRWFDKNASAQRAVQTRKQTQSIEEQDALFDRININLGQSLLQQGHLSDATAVIQNIAGGGAESELALLSYGWANAKENRWQDAMAAWQYLQQNSEGLFSLQASYGLAYAFSQQDNLGQAFYALQTTATKIDTSIAALTTFAAAVKQEAFFTHYNKQWPQSLNDLKLGFFAPSTQFNASYLLDKRLQAELLLSDINHKQTRVKQLNTLLQERQISYHERLQGMSLQNAETQINRTQQDISNLHTLITQANTFEKQYSLSKKMANEDIRAHLGRLENAKHRQARLAADTSRKRPLKTSYLARLDKIEGIIKWQLMDNFIAQQWRHKQLLNKAQQALVQAKAQLSKLQGLLTKQDAFSLQQTQFSALNQALTSQAEAASNIYDSSTNALTNQLLSLIETRIVQLQDQKINTRLAMLRIQDLQQQGGQ